MSSKAYRVPSARDRLRKHQILIRDLQAQNRNRNTPRAVASTAFSGSSSAGSTGGGTGNFLSISGGKMLGPLALEPPLDFSVEMDANNTIDIGPENTDEQNSSNIQLEDQQPNSFVLDTIAGAVYDGQILIIRTFAPSIPFTISQATIENGGNIQTPSDDDFELGDLQMIVLVYDDSLVVNANTGGTWRVLSFGGESTSQPALLLTGLTVDSATVGTIPWDNDFFFGDLTKIIATATTGVYKLLVGSEYSLEGLLQVEMDSTGAGSDLVFNWQESSAEGGPFTDIPSNQSVVGAMEIGKATLTTQPHAVALVSATVGDVFVRLFSTLQTGTFIRTLALSSIAQIETIGGGGSGGGGFSGYSTIQDEGISVIQQQTMNFIGTGVSVANDAGNNRTDITIDTAAGDVSQWSTFPALSNVDIDGYNILMDIDGDTFWKGERDGLADDWIQLLVGGTIGFNISNRVGNEWIRLGLNLEPSSENDVTGQTLGSDSQRWTAAYIGDFVDIDGHGAPANPGSTEGRLYWNSSTDTLHTLNSVGNDIDLGGGADASQWATFDAIADVVPDSTGRTLGSAALTEQWGGIFMSTSSNIRWDNGGVFTDILIQGTTGGFISNVPLAGSYSYRINSSEVFKIFAESVSINTPTLDFNSPSATIEGLLTLNLTADTSGSITGVNLTGTNGFNGDTIFHDITGTTPGHLFGIDGSARVRISTGILDLRPDDTKDPTAIDHAEFISFVNPSTFGKDATNPTIGPSSANDLFIHVPDAADLIELNFGTASDSIRYDIGETIFDMLNGAGTIRITPIAGNDLRMSKIGGNEATFVSQDNFLFENDGAGLSTTLRGFLNGLDTVPSQLLFDGRNSISADHTYGEIRSRIKDSTSGSENGDLELYTSIGGSSFEMLTAAAERVDAFNAPVINARADLEIISAAGANHLILNEVDMQMQEVTVIPSLLAGQDGTMFLFDDGAGTTTLFFRFANGQIKTLANDIPP